MSILNASKNQSFTAYSEAMVFSLVNTEAHTKDGKKKKKRSWTNGMPSNKGNYGRPALRPWVLIYNNRE